MRFLLVAVLVSMTLPGCSARQPAISDIRSDVVKVQTQKDILTPEPSPQQIRAEAQRGCREYGNVVSHALSNRCIERDGLGYCMQKEYLYACKPPDSIDPTIPDPS